MIFLLNYQLLMVKYYFITFVKNYTNVVKFFIDTKVYKFLANLCPNQFF